MTMSNEKMPLEESELLLVTTKLVLFIIMDDHGSALVCGSGVDIERLKGDNAKFWFIGAASVGMKKGVIGEFSRLDREIFKEVPCV